MRVRWSPAAADDLERIIEYVVEIINVIHGAQRWPPEG
jgi:plasmid stabilization system protein ParE